MRPPLAIAASLFALAFTSYAHAGPNVALADLPAAARATVERITQGNPIEEIEREHKRGVVYFEVEYFVDIEKWELHVGEDGAVLKHELD